MTSFEVRLNKQAKRLKISHRNFGTMLKAMRITADPGTYLSHKRGAGPVLRQSGCADFIPKDRAFRHFGPDDLPGLGELVAASQAVYRTRMADNASGASRKPFFSNVLEPADLQAQPAIMDFVLSDTVLQAVMGYLGAVPRLLGLGLYVSPPNDSLESSQMFHFDGDDLRQVKCFINLVEVNQDNGPFTFYDAAASANVEQRLGRPWGAYRYDDADIADACQDTEPQVLAGPPGTGAFVDTARCVHFGSRSRRSERAVLMFHFVTVPDLRISKARKTGGRAIFDFATDRYRGDPLRSMILSGRKNWRKSRFPPPPGPGPC